jgi:hypothetical protein
MVPARLDKTEISAALRASRNESGLSRRIELLSARFLGRGYASSPLGGGPDLKEVLSAATDDFDCVTFVETVLALSLSHSPTEFVRKLTLIRYHKGSIDWKSRNHYMVDWARRNQKSGFIRDCTKGERLVIHKRTLNLVPGLGAKSVALHCLPKRTVARRTFGAESADVVMFVSTRRDLDVFHLGFVIKRDGILHLRHASRTAGRVVEERLVDFVRKHRMSGVILLRPQCQK